MPDCGLEASGDLQFGCAGLKDGGEGGGSHHLGSARKSFGENPDGADDLLGIQAQVDEPLNMRGCFGISTGVHRGVGIFCTRHAHRVLNALQQA